MKKTILLSIVFLVCRTSHCEIRGGSECSDVKCKNPPDNAKCNELDPSSEKDIPRPTGSKMQCCPLWKCKQNDSSKFFTFHGLNGSGPMVSGSETVHYQSDEQMGRSVTSTADGGHDSVANAATKEEMDELAQALADAGIS